MKIFVINTPTHDLLGVGTKGVHHTHTQKQQKQTIMLSISDLLFGVLSVPDRSIDEQDFLTHLIGWTQDRNKQRLDKRNKYQYW